MKYQSLLWLLAIYFIKYNIKAATYSLVEMNLISSFLNSSSEWL